MTNYTHLQETLRKILFESAKFLSLDQWNFLLHVVLLLVLNMFTYSLRREYEQHMCLQPLHGQDSSKRERGNKLRRLSWAWSSSKAKPELHHLIAM